MGIHGWIADDALVTLVIKIVLSVVVLLALIVAGLRVRKLRHDEFRKFAVNRDQRLMKPPPSPYVASKGFRLLDEDGNVTITTRPEPPRPRLDPNHEYVFGDAQVPQSSEAVTAAGALAPRHDARWALDRSVHRSRVPVFGLRGVLVVVLIAGVGAAAAYALLQHHPGVTTTTTTTSSVPRTTTTRPAWPSAFVPTSTGSQGAVYSVPATHYEVTVRGSLGAVWVVYRMGPNATLEYQGDVGSGQSKTLEMTGVSSVSLGSPKSATVSVGGSPVTFPASLTSPLVLTFTPTSPGSG